MKDKVFQQKLNELEKQRKKGVWKSIFKKVIATFAIALTISLIGLLFGVVVPIHFVVVPAIILGQLASDSKKEVEAKKSISALKLSYNEEKKQEIGKELNLNQEKESVDKDIDNRKQKTVQKQKNKDAGLQL